MTERATLRAAGEPRTSSSEPFQIAAERVPLDGRRPRLLDDPTLALQMVRGHADLFAVPIASGAAVGARHHLCRIEAGGIILGLPFAASEVQGQSIGVLAVGGQGAEARILGRSLIDDRELIEAWITALATSHAATESDWNVRVAEPGSIVALDAGEQVRAPPHGIAWISIQEGEIALMGGAFICRAGEPPMPFTSGMWGQARSATTLRAVDGELALGANPWPAVERYHAFAMDCVIQRLTDARQTEFQRLHQRARSMAAKGGHFIDELSSVIVRRRKAGFTTDGSDPLLDACRITAQAIGTSIVAPLNRTPSRQGLEDVADIARASHVRARRVLLRAEWWGRDSGPLVAWHGTEREPVALIPVTSRRYVMVGPRDGVSRRVDAALAAGIAPEAMMLYAPLPALSGSLSGLAAFCFRHSSTDIARVILTTVAMGALGLATPLITEVLVDSVIPRTELNQLMYCAAALAMVAVGIAGFKVVQSAAILRLEGTLDRILQAGVVDRILRLPVAFFRQFAAGDLTDRALGVEAIRRISTAHAVQGLLSGVFALFSFGLMFYLDARLAFVALGLTSVRVLVVALTGVARLRRERRHFDLDGKAQGLVLQLLTGVGKLRVASATSRALAVWARKFAEQKDQFVASQRAANWLNAFEAAFPTLTLLAIFAAAWHGDGKLALDTGEFLAFFVAFGQSSEALGQLAAAISAMIIAIPRIDRLRPLVATPLEIAGTRNPPGDLIGAIELGQVTFRYSPEGPPILDKLTMQVGPGEYVALVGPSGSGKSTIFRLLLGFEKPDSGTIFFDGKAIDALDMAAVRRQFGVVVQNGKLATGSLYENICAGATLPLERAWEAARLAGLDRDIEAMPMGMHTVISEGTNTLSGGQCQRLMIARALVHHPRILLFDEATSALDNRTQAIVSASLAKLNVTRIVIAQRLSTVRDADRIVVLSGGKIVQSGTFTELAAAPGLFAEFAKRQLLQSTK
jgi:NHLM bacteriocin system ABC transporter ATP-binding protein